MTDPSLTVGRAVAGLSGGAVKGRGAQAEEVVLPAADVAVLPEGLDPVAAASVPLNALTADQALALLGEPDGTLLVTGAAGGVGGYVVPLAAALGWQVVGLARASDRDYVESLGGRLVVDPADLDTPVDAVIDAAVLGAVASDAVRAGGRVIEVVPGTVPAREGVSIQTLQVVPDGARLADLLVQTVDGRLPARVRTTLPITELERAYAVFAEGGRGRVVLTAA